MINLMRSILLFTVFILFSAVQITAQEVEPDINILSGRSGNLHNQIELSKVLALLEKIYGVNFIYEDDVVDNVNVTISDDFSGNIISDLQTVLRGQNLKYSLVGEKTFIILNELEPESHLGQVRGFVSDMGGQPLAGSEVVINDQGKMDLTDYKGAYIINDIPEGKYSLLANIIGYKPKTILIEVKPGKIINQNFFLELDVLDMEEIVTVACKNPFKKLESSVAITTANSRQIAERAPYSTAELLKAIPGFYVESSGGEVSNNLFPRGIPQDGSYRYVAMYEDGLPLFEAPELAFANIDILMRLDESVKSMEGVRGGTSSIYASNAPGGIINFLSRTGGNRREVIMKISAGSQDFKRLDFNYGGPISEKYKFNAGGFFRYSKGLRTPDFTSNRGGQFKMNITRLFEKGFFRVYGKYLNDRNIFYLPIPLQNAKDPESIPGLDANYGTLTSVHARKAAFPSPRGTVYQRDIRDGIHPEQLSFTSEFMFEFAEGWSLQNSFRIQKTDIEFNAIFPLDNPFNAAFFADSVKNMAGVPGAAGWEYRYAANGMPIKDIQNLNNNGLIARNGWWTISKPLKSIANSLQINKLIGSHKLSIAGYFSRYSAGDFWYWQNILTEVKNAPELLDLAAVDEAGNTVYSATDNGFEQYGSFYVNADNNASVYAAYITDEWQASDNLRFDTGVRFESHNYKGKVENTRDDYIIGQGETGAEKNVIFGDGTFRHYNHNFREWSVSAGSNYSINSQYALYSRISRGFRTPDFEQWIFSEEKGNSQYIYQMEGGLKIASPYFSLFSSVFFSHINNIPFIDEVVNNGRIVQEKRFADSRTIGAEMEAVVLAGMGIRFDLIGTIQDPKLKHLKCSIVDPETGSAVQSNLSGNQVRRIPTIMVDFRPSYMYKKFRFYYSWQYIGERYVDDANTAKLPGYNLISAGGSFKTWNDRVMLALNISNLTNSVGLTEGNPRIEQAVASRRDDVFMARPILGRSITLGLTLKF